jgi:hypothetical protein
LRGRWCAPFWRPAQGRARACWQRARHRAGFPRHLCASQRPTRECASFGDPTSTRPRSPAFPRRREAHLVTCVAEMRCCSAPALLLLRQTPAGPSGDQGFPHRRRRIGQRIEVATIGGREGPRSGGCWSAAVTSAAALARAARRKRRWPFITARLLPDRRADWFHATGGFTHRCPLPAANIHAPRSSSSSPDRDRRSHAPADPASGVRPAGVPDGRRLPGERWAARPARGKVKRSRAAQVGNRSVGRSGSSVASNPLRSWGLSSLQPAMVTSARSRSLSLAMDRPSPPTRSGRSRDRSLWKEQPVGLSRLHEPGGQLEDQK